MTSTENAHTCSCTGLTDGAATECASHDNNRDVIEAATAAAATAAGLRAVFFCVLTEEYDGPKLMVSLSFGLSLTSLSLRSCGTRSLTQPSFAPPSLSLSSSSKNFFKINPRILRGKGKDEGVALVMNATTRLHTCSEKENGPAETWRRRNFGQRCRGRRCGNACTGRCEVGGRAFFTDGG